MEVGLIIFLVVIVLLYCITFAFVKYYQDKDDTMEFLPTFVVMTMDVSHGQEELDEVEEMARLYHFQNFMRARNFDEVADSRP